MHIGFDAKRFFHNATGLGNYSRSTIWSLARRFPEHRYFLYSARVPKAMCTSDNKEFLVVQEACPLGRIFPSIWRTAAIPRTARHDNLDIYHGLSHELPLLPFSPQTRTVVSVHDLLFLTHPHLYPWVDRQIYTLKYAHSCRRADIVVAISHKTANDVHELFGIPHDRIRVAYQSCHARFALPVDDTTLAATRHHYNLPHDFILFVGSLIERKGVRSLIRALAHISPSRRPALVIVGAGPLDQELRREADTLGLSTAVHLLGRVPDDHLPSLYRLARVFAYPSMAEGFGIPILEALFCGVPVVTSTGSCFSEPGGEAALYVPPGDVSGLALALEKVLTDQALRAEMIKRGNDHAQHFHWDRTAERLMNIYTEICPNSARSMRVL